MAVSNETLRLANRALRQRQDADGRANAYNTGQVIVAVDALNTLASVGKRVDDHRLLAFKADDGRSNLYPAWEFGPDSGVLDGVAELAAACHELHAGDVVAFDLLVRTPSERLEGRSVAELLVLERAAEAVAAVRAPREQDG